MPHVAAAILGADDSVQTASHQLGEHVAQCPVFTAELLALCGGEEGTDCSVQALGERTGAAGLRLLALTRATTPAPVNPPKAWWLQSIRAAAAARELAAGCGFSRPEEAYVAGLLHNLGELVLLVYAPEEYGELYSAVDDGVQRMLSEQQAFGVTHADLGADLVDSWGLESFLSDALRHHHQPLEFVQHAHQLVRITHVAAWIAAGDRERAGQAAEQLLDIGPGTLDKCVDSTSREAERIQAAWKEHGEEATDWSEPVQARVRDLALLEAARPQFEAGDRDDLLQHLAQAARWLIGARRMGFFAQENQRLVGLDTPLNPRRLRELEIPMDAPRSLIAKAARTGDLLHTLAPKAPALAVVDRQVQHLLGADVMACLPVDARTIRGVMVLGVETGHLDAVAARGQLLVRLVQRLASQAPKPPESRTAEGTANQKRLRNLRHEINNPLSTVRNYIHVLQVQLGDDHAASAHLDLLQQEVGRVAQLVDEIPGSRAELQDPASVDVNALLEDWLRMSVESLPGANRIELDLMLDADLPPIETDANAVKQILLNLARNAVEAMEGSGTLTLRTRDFYKIDGTPGIEVDVEDTGPGLPESVLERLFEPVETTKGEGHSGLGLSIVKELVDRLDGSIRCDSSAQGTRFQIVLPRNVTERTTTRIAGENR
ncbi:MAG: HDOD domain-containing protein [Xanthomonadales bacterium]|nr:HDOD domain-containing protein [Xanthomonadales bacterium]